MQHHQQPDEAVHTVCGAGGSLSPPAPVTNHQPAAEHQRPKRQIHDRNRAERNAFRRERLQIAGAPSIEQIARIVDEHSQGADQQPKPAARFPDPSAQHGQHSRPHRNEKDGMRQAPVPHLITARRVPPRGDDVDIGNLGPGYGRKQQRLLLFARHPRFVNGAVQR